ncbi:helix-turn-helix domain-containing protein, partial [Nonomuraea sp. NPDC000554]|uniref:helix-turn-helix domain-containing protein n=1 Tax=Nonomuraea sp. NPDC000554 TaxID=3154259 RepID=UPI003322C3C7
MTLPSLFRLRIFLCCGRMRSCVRRTRVRVYPTPEQAAVLNRTFGCVRLVWNKTLAWRQHR